MTMITGRAACRRCYGVNRCYPGCQTKPLRPGPPTTPLTPSGPEVTRKAAITLGTEVLRKAAVDAGIRPGDVDQLFGDGLVLHDNGPVRVTLKVLPL